MTAVVARVRNTLPFLRETPEQPRPPLPWPLVWRKDDPRRWTYNTALVVGLGLLGAFFFGGAFSGFYDATTQVFHPIKTLWDSLLAEGQRHLYRDGGIVLLAALAYKSAAFNYYKYRYAKIGWLDRAEHATRIIPNIKYSVQKGEALTRPQKVALPFVVVAYAVIMVFAIYQLYYLVRAGLIPSLPPLTIPKANPGAHASLTDQATSWASDNWKVKLAFLPAVLVSLRPIRGAYLVWQDYLVKGRIGRRLRRLEKRHKSLQHLSTKAPFYWTPPWKARYSDLAGAVKMGLIDRPAPMSRRARRWIWAAFLVAAALSAFGHWWLSVHT